MSTPFVEVSHLGKTYEPSPLWLRLMLRSAIHSPVVALDDVSFEVGKGEICAMVGANGAGKSTLLRILTGLVTPTAGSAKIVGLDVNSRAGDARRMVGSVPADDRALWLRHSVRQNLEFHGRLRRIHPRELSTRIEEMLGLVGLTAVADRAGAALSSGMRSRLMIARALLHRPSVLLLDEPTRDVDLVGAWEILEMVRQLAHDEGLAVLMATHRFDEIEALQANLVVLDGGRLVHRGDVANTGVTVRQFLDQRLRAR